MCGCMGRDLVPKVPKVLKFLDFFCPWGVSKQRHSQMCVCVCLKRRFRARGDGGATDLYPALEQVVIFLTLKCTSAVCFFCGLHSSYDGMMGTTRRDV